MNASRIYIPFVDIQHGIQGRFQGSYYWKCTPAGDWSTVPPHLLCWTESDKALFKSGHRGRSAHNVGPSWFRLQNFLLEGESKAAGFDTAILPGSALGTDHMAK